MLLDLPKFGPNYVIFPILFQAWSKFLSTNRPIRLTQCGTQFKSPGIKILCVLICIIMWHSHLNDMETPETKRFIPKGFELGTTLS